MTKSLALVAAALLCARTASAQIAEVGIGIGRNALAYGGDFWNESLDSASLDGRVSLAASDRIAIEAFFSYGRRTLTDTYAGVGGGRRQEGFFGFDIKQRLRATTRPGFHAFLTYGIEGFHVKTDWPARRSSNGFVQLSESDGYVSAPGFPFVGGGVQKVLAHRLAVRGEATVAMFLWYPVGVRAVVGASVPIGRGF